MERSNHEAVLTSIQNQRTNHPLSILTLAEPILSDNKNIQAQDEPSANRDSSSAGLTLSPKTLAADLQHYRDLFSKLRFSYLEQVTKEKYLRSIVGDPPVLWTSDDNLALEDRLAGMKAELKAKKEENENLVKAMEDLAAKLAEQYEIVSKGMKDLEVLPVEITELEVQVQMTKEALRQREEDMELDGPQSDEPRMNMSLQDTRDAVEEQKRRIREVDEQIAALQGQLPAKIRECERAERELEEVEVRRNEATRLASEMQRIREEGGRDVLEDQGRWLRGEEAILRSLLGVGVES